MDGIRGALSQLLNNKSLLQPQFIPILLAVAIVLLSVIYYVIKNRNVLPGPSGVPYFGLYPFIRDETCHLQFTEYCKKYGDAYSFTFLGNHMINLGSIKAMRELHVSKADCFSGRFRDWNILTHVMNDGVTMVNGEPWSVQRKFFLQKFKEYGLNTIKDNLSGPVYDSLAATVDDLKARKGKPFNVVELLTERCTVTLHRLFFGEDGITHDWLLKINSTYGAALECMAGTGMLLIGPFGKFLFHTVPRLREGLKQHEVLRSILYDSVRKMESKLDEQHTTCIIDDYIKERNERKRKGDPTWKIFSDKALVETLSQFIGDGILGVAEFTGLFLTALFKHPEEQDKLYKEIMEVVGPTRQPTLEDKSRLTYTNAFMNEVVRTACLFPLFPSLKCSKETTYKGYKIPKGSITMLNFWAANHDPSTFENPYKFDPTRYISAPGKPKAESPILFGLGKRACLGEAFVMMQAFLFLTTIIKNFEIIPPDDPEKNTAMNLMLGHLELSFKYRGEK